MDAPKNYNKEALVSYLVAGAVFIVLIAIFYQLYRSYLPNGSIRPTTNIDMRIKTNQK